MRIRQPTEGVRHATAERPVQHDPEQRHARALPIYCTVDSTRRPGRRVGGVTRASTVTARGRGPCPSEAVDGPAGHQPAHAASGRGAGPQQRQPGHHDHSADGDHLPAPPHSSRTAATGSDSVAGASVT
jgi:hypothetical protein